MAKKTRRKLSYSISLLICFVLLFSIAALYNGCGYEGDPAGTLVTNEPRTEGDSSSGSSEESS